MMAVGRHVGPLVALAVIAAFALWAERLPPQLPELPELPQLADLYGPDAEAESELIFTVWRPGIDPGRVWLMDE
jgi:hypothetical protein